MTTMTRAARAAVLLVAGTAAACGGRHHLGDYDFGGRTVAVASFPAPGPELRTRNYGSSSEDALGAVLAAGGRVAREMEGRKARARLDSAASRIDVASRVADRTLERASRYLGARAVPEEREADFILEVDLRSLGIDVRRDNSLVFVSGEAILLDGRTGREIWNQEVRSYDPITSDMVDTPVLEDILTAGALSSVSVADFERILGRLADYAADRITRELREDLRDARR
jgi:hypothetical protein